jgi:hypothetical protein
MRHNLVMPLAHGNRQQYSLLCYCMDEGTIKIPIPKCRLYWCLCLGLCSNCVDSESGQKQSNRVLSSCKIWSTTQFNTPPPPPLQPHTVSVSILREMDRGGGRGGQREGRGATVHKRGRKYQHDRLYLQSINSIKHQ